MDREKIKLTEQWWVSRRLSMKITLLIVISFCTLVVEAKSKVVRKVQEVNFQEASLKGTIRNPDGAYLVQKRGMKFLPLVEIQKDMDSKIRNAGVYVH